MLEEALSLLGPEDDELRAVTLAHLATTAPLAYDEEASSAQVALARELTARTSSIHARFGVLTAELYLAGGRMHGTSAGEAELAFETFCQQGALPFSAVMLDLHRAVIEMQRNDRRRAIVALARAETQCRALGSRELLWHVERFQVLEQLNVHDDPAVHECLRALHRRAREHAIVGTDLLIAYDEVLALGDDLSPAAILTLCTPDPADPPSVWSMRVRLLAAAGLHDDALHLLRKVRPDRLGALPRDRDHVGTLGALARAALDLDAQDYLEALSPLLAAHADKLAVHVAFHSEGPVSALVTAIDAVLRLDERTVVAVQSSRARRAGAPSQ